MSLHHGVQLAGREQERANPVVTREVVFTRPEI